MTCSAYQKNAGAADAAPGGATTVSGGTVFNGGDNAGSLPYLLNPTPYGFNGAFYYTKVSYKF